MKNQWIYFVLISGLLSGCQSGVDTPAKVDLSHQKVDIDKNLDADGKQLNIKESVVYDEDSLQVLAKNWPLLKVGSRGNQVSAAQHLLKAHGIYSGGQADGIFGKKTEKTVKEFQRSKDLGDDGKIGKDTWEKLIIVIKRGHQNKEAVKAVQVLVGKNVDGAFGPDTDQAVRDFQRKKGLKVDGVVRKNTWHALVNHSVGDGNSGGTTRAQLAQSILKHPKIKLLAQGDTQGASPLNTLKRTSQGLKVRRGCHNDANCGGQKIYIYLQESMLRGILKMANQSPYQFQINSTSGGRHSKKSRHYRGLAIDINMIDGKRVRNNPKFSRKFMEYCRKAGSDEVLGPGDKGHHHHIHCGWK